MKLTRPFFSRRFALGCASFAILAGCSSDASSPGSVGFPNTPTLAALTILADTNRNGVIDEKDPAERANKETWDATHGAIFLANLDDDSERCPRDGDDTDQAFIDCNDASDEEVNGADDLNDLAPLRITAWPDAPEGTVAQLSVNESAAGWVRLFRKRGDGFVVFDPTKDALATEELRAGLDLRIEGKSLVVDPAVWDGFVDLAVFAISNEKTIATDRVRMKTSPLVFSSHVDQARRLLFPNPKTVPRGAKSGTEIYEKGLTEAASLVLLPSPTVVGMKTAWTQDEMEKATIEMPSPSGAQTMSVYLRAPTSRDEKRSTDGLFIFRELRGKDAAAVYVYEHDRVQSMKESGYSGFGNLEMIPPFENGSKRYPMGRLVIGFDERAGQDPAFKKMVDAQEVQPPLYINNRWLWVGHMDEYLSIVPVDSPRGWIALVADPKAARDQFVALKEQGLGDTPLFKGLLIATSIENVAMAETTVNGILDNEDVMAQSQAASIELDKFVVQLKEETGITDSEIVRIPFLWHPVEGSAVAYQPGFTNGVSFGRHVYAMPEAHGPIVNGRDVFKDRIEALLAPFEVNVHWVEDWPVHMAFGEIHCASYLEREAPKTFFWQVSP